MFKNLIIYSIFSPTNFDLETLTECAEIAPFVPTGSTQKKSYGWVPPRGQHEAPVELIDGQYLLRFRQETRTVAPSNLQKALDEACDQYEKQNGYKPGKKLRKELREEAELTLLPFGVLAQKAVWVWIDKHHKRIYMDTASQSVADTIATLLVESIKGLGIGLLFTNRSAQAAMAQWLLDSEPPPDFSIDRYLQLKAADESKATVRYERHALDTDEVKEHIREGKLPVACEFTYDDRLSFRLQDCHKLSKLAFLDVVMESNRSRRDDGDDALSTDMSIASAEITSMVDALIEALDGLDDGAIGSSTSDTKTTGTKPKKDDSDDAPWDGDDDDDDWDEDDDDDL